MEIAEEFTFLDSGELVDGDLELVLLEKRAAVPAKGRVPEYKFEMRHTRTGEKAGSISLRTCLTPRLAEYGGHIGYEVEPKYRGSYFAARSCRLLFSLAAAHGIDPLLITCASDNVASRKTCDRIGAELVKLADAETETEVRSTCYYHVNLKTRYEFIDDTSNAGGHKSV